MSAGDVCIRFQCGFRGNPHVDERAQAFRDRANPPDIRCNSTTTRRQRQVVSTACVMPMRMYYMCVYIPQTSIRHTPDQVGNSSECGANPILTARMLLFCSDSLAAIRNKSPLMYISRCWMCIYICIHFCFLSRCFTGSITTISISEECGIHVTQWVKKNRPCDLCNRRELNALIDGGGENTAWQTSDVGRRLSSTFAGNWKHTQNYIEHDCR